MENTVKADYNFKVEHKNNAHYITYSKDKFGAGLGCGIFVMVLLMTPLISLVVKPLANYPVFLWLILPIGLTILIFKLINRSRKEKTFVLGVDNLEVDSKQYAIADIQKFYIKDPKGNMYRTTNNGGTGFLIGGSGMGAVAVGAASVASSGARATSEIMNKSINKVNFKIEFLYGNRKIALAKGLSENNAFVLFDKVIELLN